MAKKYDLQSRLAEYRKLAAAAKAHEGVLPALAHFRAALEKAVEEIDATKKRQQNLEQLRLEATDELWDHVADGNEVAVRLKSYVRASFDLKDPRLGAFDIHPGGWPREVSEPERRNGSPSCH